MSRPAWNACSERRVARQVRHDPQLDLRIVGRYEHVPRGRDERLADAPAFGRAHRNVLQVGIARRQPPGHRRRLRERRVHAAGRRIDHLRQLVGVRRLELRQRAMLEQDLRQRIVGREFLQHLLVGRRLPGRGLLHDRQAHLLEQDLAQLLGRAQVERLPGQLVRLLLQRDDALAQLAALAREQRGVDQDAVALHAEQHLAHGHLELRVDVVELRVRRDRRVAARRAGAA